jgi:hypothetical protein
MLRGLNQDLTSNSVTGTTDETNLTSFAMSGDTLGATGTLHVRAWGTITGTNDTKTIKLIFGSTTLYTIVRNAAGTQQWLFDTWISNTTTSAQLSGGIESKDSSTDIIISNSTASNEDTTASVTIKVTGTLANSSDTISQKGFSINIVQVT